MTSPIAHAITRPGKEPLLFKDKTKAETMRVSLNDATAKTVDLVAYQPAPENAFARIDTKEWRKVTELTIARGAPCVSLHANDMLALLDELDATHEARKEAQVGLVGLHKRMNDSVHQVRIDMMKRIAAEDDAAHWKANHDNQVQRAMILTQRPDMPIERVAAYNRMLTLEATVAQLNSELDKYIKSERDHDTAQEKEMTTCTCPSGDGSLRWPCPTHPPEAVV